MTELGRLDSKDLVKFVICGREDYEWSRAKMRELALPARCTVLFSPSAEQLPARHARRLDPGGSACRCASRLQLHKVLWGNTPGR